MHEGLADIPVDDELAGLHDLAELVLRVFVDPHLQPVDAGGLVVAGAVVEIDAHAHGVRPEADPVEALPVHLVDGGDAEADHDVRRAAAGEAAPGLRLGRADRVEQAWQMGA